MDYSPQQKLFEQAKGATQASGQRGSSNAARNNRGAEAGARPLAPDRLAEVARELLKLPDSAVSKFRN